MFNEFRKGRGTRDQIANICRIIEKVREFQKNIYFCFIDYANAFDCVHHNKLWKILKEMGKEYVKAVYCYPAYLTSMQSNHEKRWAGRSTSWNQDCQEKYQTPQICRWHHPYGRKLRRTKELLDESERGEWKIWLKLNIQKTKIMASGSITSWQIDGETVADFIF